MGTPPPRPPSTINWQQRPPQRAYNQLHKRRSCHLSLRLCQDIHLMSTANQAARGRLEMDRDSADAAATTIGSNHPSIAEHERLSTGTHHGIALSSNVIPLFLSVHLLSGLSAVRRSIYSRPCLCLCMRVLLCACLLERERQRDSERQRPKRVSGGGSGRTEKKWFKYD